MSNVIARTLARLSQPSEREDKELRKTVAEVGCTPIDTQGEGNRVTLHGLVRSVTLQPRSGVPSLEAELYDGSGRVTLVWLGRRRIGGISPGRQITVEGRLGRRDGERVLYNPRYELMP